MTLWVQLSLTLLNEERSGLRMGPEVLSWKDYEYQSNFRGGGVTFLSSCLWNL